MIAITITALICATVLALFVLYLRAVSTTLQDDITVLRAGQESHSARLELLERDSRKHGEALTRSALGKMR